MGEVREDPVPCKYFGQKLGVRWLNNRTGIGVYSCGHPDHPETTLEKCWSCRDYVELGILPQRENNKKELKVEIRKPLKENQENKSKPKKLKRQLPNASCPIM